MRSFETMQISYFCLNVHPLILAFLLDFACSKLLLGYPDGDFLFLFFLLHSLIGIFLEGRLPLPFFIYLIIYLLQMNSWIFISLSELESNPIIISFVVQVVWTLVTGSFLGLAPGTFQNTSTILFVWPCVYFLARGCFGSFSVSQSGTWSQLLTIF